MPKKYSALETGFERRTSAVPDSYSSDIEPAAIRSAVNWTKNAWGRKTPIIHR